MPDIDRVHENFTRKFMGKTGLITGRSEVVRVRAVMTPRALRRIEVVVTPEHERSPDEEGLARFPSAEFEGISIEYRGMDVHLKLLD